MIYDCDIESDAQRCTAHNNKQLHTQKKHAWDNWTI